MANPTLNPCPFEGYASPSYVTESGNDGMPRYHVICPICRCRTSPLATIALAATQWNTRSVPTYTTWLAALAAWKAANTPTADVAPAYTTWLASAATEAGVAADVAAFETWIVAHPPAANAAPTYVTWEAAFAAWIVAHPPVAD
jgi:hypothetical protein